MRALKGEFFVINQLFEQLAALPQVEAIALGGSRAGEVFDAGSDYDIYLYRTAPVPEEARRAILEPVCTVLEIGNSFWELEDNGTLKNGIDFDILYRDLDSFSAGIGEVVENFRAGNGYTTCMWHNLSTCKIICDKAGRLQRAKDRFSVPYPKQLKENIIRRNMQLLRGAMPAYEGQILKAAGRGDVVSLNHRTAAFLESYFDILFALNEQTHPGEKRLLQLCRRNCPILPAHFEENVERLLADLFHEPQSVAGHLDRIIRELEQILP